MDSANTISGITYRSIVKETSVSFTPLTDGETYNAIPESPTFDSGATEFAYRRQPASTMDSLSVPEALNKNSFFGDGTNLDSKLSWGNWVTASGDTEVVVVVKPAETSTSGGDSASNEEDKSGE